MTTLEWSEIDGIHLCDGYRIERGVERGWFLLLDSPSAASLAPRRFSSRRRFGSLPAARAAALHLEVVRVRRVKLVRHVTVAIVMFVLAVVFYIIMVAGTPKRQLEWFIISAASLVIAFSEGLDAFVLLVADGWDHGYEVPGVSRVDRIVSGLVVAVLWPRPTPVQESDRVVIVRPLT